MTREEAWKRTKGYLWDILDGEEADEIIKALEQEPCENCCNGNQIEKAKLCQKSYLVGMRHKQEPCEDAISRQYLLDNCVVDKVTMPYVPVSKIESAPPVTPQPKMGRWLIVDDCEQFIAKCSKCGRIEDSRMISKYPYCHCGAKMV